MAFLRRRAAWPALRGERVLLRPPELEDHLAWAALRRESRAFLVPWEPSWARDHLSARAFRERVGWSSRAIAEGRAYPLFVVRRDDGVLLGATTLDNVRRGPSMAATLGYWIGERHARRGYMTDALETLRAFAFGELDLSRLEAACLPENAASRALLRRVGFREEGSAKAYLQIDGRWRTHVLHALLREDREGGG